MGRNHACDELEILGNMFGSTEYENFLNNVGSLVRLADYHGFTGGLDKESDVDGEYAVVWTSSLTQVRA